MTEMETRFVSRGVVAHRDEDGEISVLLATRPSESKREAGKLNLIGGTNPPGLTHREAVAAHIKDEIGLDVSVLESHVVS